MKMGKSLFGFAVAAALILGAATARAEFGSIAQASLDREINSPAVSTTVPASEVYDTQNRAPGSIAQESLDREINSPAVPAATQHAVAEVDPDRAPGSIAQTSLDREINSPAPMLSGERNVLTPAVGEVGSGKVN